MKRKRLDGASWTVIHEIRQLFFLFVWKERTRWLKSYLGRIALVWTFIILAQLGCGSSIENVEDHESIFPRFVT